MSLGLHLQLNDTSGFIDLLGSLFLVLTKKNNIKKLDESSELMFLPLETYFGSYFLLTEKKRCWFFIENKSVES